jgi:hypothetical protein
MDGEVVLDLGDNAVIGVLHDRVVTAFAPRRIVFSDALAEV